MKFDNFAKNLDAIIPATDYELEILKEKHPYIGWVSVHSKVVTYEIGVNNIPMYVKLTAVKIKDKKILFYRPFGRLADLDALERHIELKTNARRRDIIPEKVSRFDNVIERLKLK